MVCCAGSVCMHVYVCVLLHSSHMHIYLVMAHVHMFKRMISHRYLRDAQLVFCLFVFQCVTRIVRHGCRDVLLMCL